MLKPFVWRGEGSGRWYVERSRWSGDDPVGDELGYETWGEAFAAAVAWVEPMEVTG